MDELLTILEEGLNKIKSFIIIIIEHLGELNRAMASHNLNDMSSRSHAMLSIQIEQDLQDYGDPKGEQMTRQGKLVFVDLAGKIVTVFSRIYTKIFFFQEVKKSK
jgi:hypothetical protein